MLQEHPFERMFATPPFVRIPRMFNLEECSHIIELCKNKFESQKSELIEKGDTNEQIRKSTTRWVKNDLQTAFIFNKLNNNLESVNEQYFNFNLSGYLDVQFAEYAASKNKTYTTNDKYDWHIDTLFTHSFLNYDNNVVGSTLRKLSISILLNQQDIDFVGGNFELFNFVLPPLNTGDAIVFPSFLQHRVTEVKKGVRYSLVTWVIGPKFV